MPAELPTGTVTFLFTDLEGSTRLWEEHPEAMEPSLAHHDAILRDAVAAHDGYVVKMRGDGAHAAFADATNAVHAARDAQRAFVAEDWGSVGELRVRMGIHTGPAQARDGDYYGSAVNRAARLMSIAHGGQVVVSLATEELARDALADEVELVDLGEHRLRDLSRPERVFELRAPGLPSEFPALLTLDAYPTNLPLQLSSFVGRESELAAIVEAMQQSRLVTITGVGGVGKTRLAIQLAGHVLPSFPDGAWLFELAGVSDADGVAQLIASTLGVRERAEVGLLASIAEFLRRRTAFLVLDNCEHVLDPAARLAASLLQTCPEVRIVATSREGLAVEGEQVWPLRSLRVPGAQEPVELIAAASAVRLFVERAQKARHGFTLDATNAAAVAEICRRLDGIPLAIELAAARVSAMRPDDIAARVDERFRLLTGGRRTAVERHQTLHAAVDWSYALLTDTEQRVFARLGVFAGGFDAEAAEAIVAGNGIDPWDVVDAVASLIDKSMLDDDEPVDDTTRYRMLETLRQYAIEQLAGSDDVDSWRRHHAEHFAEMAEEIGPALKGPDELAWRPRFLAELDNLRAAVMWSLDAPDDNSALLAFRTIGALAEETAQYQASGVGIWADRSLPRIDVAPPDLRAAVLGAAAWRAFQLADLEEAKLRARGAISIPVSAACPSPHWGYIALALSETLTGDAEGGYAVIVEAARLLDALEASPATKSHLHAAGATSARTNAAVARAEGDAALQWAREARNPTCLAVSLYAWALPRRAEDPEGALAALDESIALTRAGASSGVFGYALALAATLEARRADRRYAALATLREAFEVSVDFGDRPMLITSCVHAFELLADLQAYEAAAVLAGVTTMGPMALYSIVNTAGAAERVRAGLDAAAYEREAARGAAMSYDQVVAFAFDTIGSLIADRGSDA